MCVFLAVAGKNLKRCSFAQILKSATPLHSNPLHVRPSVCPIVSLFVCLSVRFSHCLSVRLSVRVSVWLAGLFWQVTQLSFATHSISLIVIWPLAAPVASCVCVCVCVASKSVRISFIREKNNLFAVCVCVFADA